MLWLALAFLALAVLVLLNVLVVRRRSKRTCRHCRNPVSGRAEFCVYCGTSIPLVPGWVEWASASVFSLAAAVILLVSLWPSPPRPQGAWAITDPCGDVSSDFIDIAGGTVKLDSENLTVVMQLARIPRQLLFDNEAIPDGGREYAWSLYVDLDGNSQTGCASMNGGVGTILGCEYLIECSNWKAPQGEHYGRLVDETQEDLWYCDESGSWHYLRVASAEVNYDAGTLTMMVPQSALDPISGASRFYFQTYYFNGPTNESDVTDAFGIG